MGKLLTWEEEIKVLGRDFFVKESVINNIIRTVKKTYPDGTEEFLYRRAWQKLWAYL